MVSQPDTTTASGLLSQGTYVYKERTEIKNQPKVSAKAEFYVNPGGQRLLRPSRDSLRLPMD
nr:SH3 domain-containing protein [Streptococcus thermophilus]